MGFKTASLPCSSVRNVSLEKMRTTLANYRQAVICVAHGFAWGLALDLCCLCDIRICSTDTHFSVKEVDFGIVADLGSLQLLPKIAGNLSWAKEVCITARGFRAEEALQMGFVSKVEDTKAEALTQGLITGELIASKSPIATQGTKEILNYSLDHSFNDGTYRQSHPRNMLTI